MRRVALTGGIATGKSYVLARFARHALPTIDADRIVHSLLGPGSPAIDAIRARFGSTIVGDDGQVDRRLLGGMVFSDRSARADLEGILHPLVYQAIEDWFDARALEPGNWIAMADIPLLYETGREGAFDGVVVAACRPETQVSRVVARDGLSEEEARQRLEAQLPIEEKIGRADWVITTDGPFASTDAQVDGVVAAMADRWPRSR